MLEWCESCGSNDDLLVDDSKDDRTEMDLQMCTTNPAGYRGISGMDSAWKYHHILVTTVFIFCYWADEVVRAQAGRKKAYTATHLMTL